MLDGPSTQYEDGETAPYDIHGPSYLCCGDIIVYVGRRRAIRLECAESIRDI